MMAGVVDLPNSMMMVTVYSHQYAFFRTCLVPNYFKGLILYAQSENFKTKVIL